jgi:hypothetical protein
MRQRAEARHIRLGGIIHCEGSIMKRFLNASLFAAAVLSVSVGVSPAMPTVDRQSWQDVVKSIVEGECSAEAQETWSFRVDLRTRKDTRSPWGPWQAQDTFVGSYGSALARANALADRLNGLSKNNQTRVVGKRLN